MTTEVKTLEKLLVSTIYDVLSNQTDSGQSLSDVMEVIRVKPYEIIAFFDQKGIKISEQTTYQANHSLFCIPPTLRESVHTAIHNHTHDITFSNLDLEIAKKLDLQRNIIVTPGRNFYLDRPRQGWPEDKVWYDDFVDIANNIYRTRNCDRTEARHRALLRVAKHYDIAYYVTNTSGIVLDMYQPAAV